MSLNTNANKSLNENENKNEKKNEMNLELINIISKLTNEEIGAVLVNLLFVMASIAISSSGICANCTKLKNVSE